MEENMKLRLLVGIVGMLMLANIAHAKPFAYILNRGSSVSTGSITVIDVSTNTIVDSISLTEQQKRPYSIAVSPKGGRIYVASQGSSSASDQKLLIIDADQLTIVGPVTAANGNIDYIPGGMALNAAETRLYVADQTASRVHVYDLNGNDLAHIGSFDVSDSGSATNPEGIAIDNTNKRLYVAKSNVDKVGIFDLTLIEEGIENADNRAFITDAIVNASPVGIAIAKGKVFTSCALDNSVAVFPVTDPSAVTRVAVGSGPFGITASADGDRVYVANTTAAVNKFTIINANTNVAQNYNPNNGDEHFACSIAESSDAALPRFYITNLPSIEATASTNSDVTVKSLDSLTFPPTVGTTVNTSVAAGVNPCSLGNFMGPKLDWTLTTNVTAGAGAFTPAFTKGSGSTSTVLVANGAYKTFTLTPTTPTSTSVASVTTVGATTGTTSYGAASVFTVGPVTEDLTINVAFDTTTRYELTANVAGGGYCTVTSTPTGISIVEPANLGKASFAPGDVAVVASAAQGSLFAGWTSGCDSISTTTRTNDTCNVTMSTAPRAITATCNPAPSFSDYRRNGAYFDDLASAYLNGEKTVALIQVTSTPTKSTAAVNLNDTLATQNITLEGGWDFIAGTRSGHSVLAVGTFTVTTGSVVMDNITIQ
jgi:DNA-binding beta-propeller fold protein YncE